VARYRRQWGSVRSPASSRYQARSGVQDRVIATNPCSLRTVSLHCPIPLRHSYLLSKIRTRLQLWSSPAAEAVIAVTATGAATCGTRHAKPLALMRALMIFGRRVHCC